MKERILELEDYLAEIKQADKIREKRMKRNKAFENCEEVRMDELTAVGFRRWVIMNFAELKEHVLTQCKEGKNHHKTKQVLITRIASLERNITDLMELKNTT